MNGPLSRADNRKRQGRRTRPRFERLEDRLALATFKVNTLLSTLAVNLQNGRDSTGHVSLNSAIMAANAAVVITRSSFPPARSPRRTLSSTTT